MSKLDLKIQNKNIVDEKVYNVLNPAKLLNYFTVGGKDINPFCFEYGLSFSDKLMADYINVKRRK